MDCIIEYVDTDVLDVFTFNELSQDKDNYIIGNKKIDKKRVKRIELKIKGKKNE